MSAENGPVLGNRQSGQRVSYCASAVWMGRCKIKGNSREEEEEADMKRLLLFSLLNKDCSVRGHWWLLSKDSSEQLQEHAPWTPTGHRGAKLGT